MDSAWQALTGADAGSSGSGSIPDHAAASAAEAGRVQLTDAEWRDVQQVPCWWHLEAAAAGMQANAAAAEHGAHSSASQHCVRHQQELVLTHSLAAARCRRCLLVARMAGTAG